ncbi:MAG: glycosyltransferase family 4 protein [Fischerella sp. CENA71]|nr:glycosyltransferase family 4 protein [Fischerella sp. CENA71]
MSANSSILIDTRWIGSHGIGRFAHEMTNRLEGAKHLPPGLAPYPFHRLDILWQTWSLLNLRPKVYFNPGFNPPLWSPVHFVFTIYDLILLRFPEEASKLMQPYFRYVVRPAARRAYCVLTCSEFSKQEIIEWADLPEEKVVVVGCGVGAEFIPSGDRHTPGYPYLLYVGNRRPHKNLPRLLTAFAQSGISQEVKLMLSGDPDNTIIERINQLGLQDKVVFAGFIPEEKLPAYYRGAIAVVFPSLYEGFGLPALEAIACGVPVVTSTVTSLPEVVGDAGVLVDPYDVEAISEGIRLAVEDNTLRKTLISRGLARSEHFTWERTAKLTQEVLQAAAQA